MFKRILIGTFLGYICASIFLILYRFFFGGWSNFLEGSFARYDVNTILLGFLGYLFVNLLFSLFIFIIYFLIFKIFNSFKKNKNNLSKKIIYYCGIYVFLIIIFLELVDFKPILNIVVIFGLLIIFNIIYFYIKHEKKSI